MNWFFFFFCLSFSLTGQQIELFIDWHSDAKGQTLFPLIEKETSAEPALLSSLRSSLIQKKMDVCSWEKDKYYSWCLSWAAISGWQDFKFWMGWDLPRKNPMLDKTSYWVFWGLGPQLKSFNFSRVNPKNLILFLWEPPIVQPEGYDPKIQKQFGKIFTWNDDLVDNIQFFKFYYPVLKPKIPNSPSFEVRKFCTLIASRLSSKHSNSLYEEREKIIRFFENKPEDFALYGRFWEKRNFKNYKGPIPNKIEVLKNYKFCICYENTKNMKGYITEKIFDCFSSGTVPIYWGASNIEDYIPKESFIDRRQFLNDEDLYRFLKEISKEQYECYLSSAEDFIKSKKARLFSVDHFISTFISNVIQ